MLLAFVAVPAIVAFENLFLREMCKTVKKSDIA
jgi:hypothetical protein